MPASHRLKQRLCRVSSGTSERVHAIERFSGDPAQSLGEVSIRLAAIVPLIAVRHLFQLVAQVNDAQIVKVLLIQFDDRARHSIGDPVAGRTCSK